MIYETRVFLSHKIVIALKLSVKVNSFILD